MTRALQSSPDSCHGNMALLRCIAPGGVTLVQVRPERVCVCVCVCVCVSYMGFLPPGLKQQIVVVLSQRRVYIGQLGCWVLQRPQRALQVARIHSLVYLYDCSNPYTYNH